MVHVTHTVILFTIAAWAVICIWTVLNSRFNIYLNEEQNDINPRQLLQSFVINENLDDVGIIHNGPIIPITTNTPIQNEKKNNKQSNLLKRKQQRNMARKKIKMDGISPKELFLSRMIRPNKYQDRGKDSTSTKDMPLFIEFYNSSYNDNNMNINNIEMDISDILFDKSTIHMILPTGFQYIWLENNDKLKFCNGVPTRLGNVLSGYWTARSLAYFLGVQFELIYPHKYVKERCVPHLSNERVKRIARYFFDENYIVKYRKSVKSNTDEIHEYDGLYWSNYLDKIITKYSILEDYKHILNKDTYLEIIEWVYSIVKHVKFEDLSIADGFETKQLTYLSDFRLLWENPMYLDHVLIPSTHNAFNEYMLYTYNKTSQQIREEIFSSDKDIVLHYRCGDIALVSNLKRHGFLSMSFYKQALDQSGWRKYLQNDDITVWIVTQQNNYKCVQIVDAALPSLIEIFAPATVKLVKHEKVFGIDGTKALNMDFFRMVNAPLLLCSTSTFCDQSAIANVNKVIFPSIGCWIGWLKNPKHWHPDNHHYINVNRTTLLLNPGRFNVQHIIDFILNN
eukprot:422262_1